MAPDAASCRRMPDARAVPEMTSVPLPSSSTSTSEDDRTSDSTVLNDTKTQTHIHTPLQQGDASYVNVRCLAMRMLDI